MGTDIHMMAERRTQNGWEPAVPIVRRGDREEFERIYDERNYDLFAILANVRNGSGYGFIPIAEPRGVPGDYSLSIDDDRAWLGDHSWSWLTVRELFDFDWSQVAVRLGIVNGPEYAKWRFLGEYRSSPMNYRPDYYAASVWGPSIEHVDEAEMERRVDALYEEAGSRRFWEVEPLIKERLSRVYTQVEWPQNYAYSAGGFYVVTMPRLKKMAGGDLDSVRIVFGFDN